jgi:hypothetical protein
MLTTTGGRRRLRRVGLATFLAAVGPPATVAGSLSEATSLSCGSVITTDVRLDADLVDCPSQGLVVGAPGIIIDLNGHIIDGTGSGWESTTTAATTTSASPVAGSAASALASTCWRRAVR